MTPEQADALLAVARSLLVTSNLEEGLDRLLEVVEWIDGGPPLAHSNHSEG